MLKGLKSNNRGIVFITVLMILIVSMVLVINVISMNVSQVMIAEGEVKRLQAEMLAMGMLAFVTANQQFNSAGTMFNQTINLGDTQFDLNASLTPSSEDWGDTNSVNISVTYE